MKPIDRMKLLIMSQTEQLRAEFDEFASGMEDDLFDLIVTTLEEEQYRPEMMAIMKMAKLCLFEAMLKLNPPCENQKEN